MFNYELAKKFEGLLYASEIIPDLGEMEARLRKVAQEKRPLVIKFGVDPTSPNLHLGHLPLLRLLADFQHEHSVVLLIGDFTACIGDPSGRSKSRVTLSSDEVKTNIQTYRKQIFCVLSEEKINIVFNSSWYLQERFSKIFSVFSNHSMTQLLEREDFQRRLRGGDGISFSEMMYPLLQGYDSVMLKADVELGGVDQRLNLLAGRRLQKEVGLEPQICVLFPLLEGLDGSLKMSKSYGNAVNFEDSPKDIFGKIMSIPDSLSLKYFRQILRKDIEELEKRLQTGENPKVIKMQLAKEIVGFFYGMDEASKQCEEFEMIFAKKEEPKEIPGFAIPDGKILWIDFLFQSGLVASKSEGRRLIRGGSVTLIHREPDNVKKVAKLTNELQFFDAVPGDVVKIGKRTFIRLEDGR